MKNIMLYLFVACLFLFVHQTYANEKVKFGTVSKDELEMTSYPQDTSAVAVVLYESCDVYYNFSIDGIELIKEYTTRIKILKKGGLEWGNAKIRYYDDGTSKGSEVVSSVLGFTYNLSNGNQEKTKLSKEYIFKEKTSEVNAVTKLAFPNVKVGSVIEYKYKLVSPYYRYIDDYFFQQSIPVKYSSYTVAIPEYFKFSKRVTGYETIDCSSEKENVTYLFPGGLRHTCFLEKIVFKGVDLPALKADSYIWNAADFMSMAQFELAGVAFPGSYYESFAYTWEDVDKRLLDDDRFGGQLRSSGLLKDELNNLIKDEMEDTEKIALILDLVKEKVKWNDENKLYIKNIKKALKEGIGSSAEMNGLLLVTLRDAGFDAYPVVMSSKSNGRIFPMYPSINKLNYFIVGVESKGKQYYMDASSKYGSLDVLSPECMVDNARAVKKNGNSQWVDLHNLGKAVVARNVIASYNKDGFLSGSVLRQTGGIASMSSCSNYFKSKDESEYIEKLSSLLNVTVNDFKINGCEKGTCDQRFTFVDKNSSASDEFLYINPFLFYSDTENPFKAETRKLPVEFPNPYNEITKISLQIPEGYEVKSVPKSERIVFPDGAINYSFVVHQDGGFISILSNLNVRESIFSQASYAEIRNTWAYMASRNGEQIVLQRKPKTN